MLFIAIEGIDNVGKTTICKILEERLSKSFTVHMISDPPNISPWSSLRDTILGNSQISATARAIVLLGMRVDSFNRSVRPRIAKSGLLLADRFFDSWFAYQLPKATKHFKTARKARTFLESLNKICLDYGLLAVPDRTFVIIGDVSETTKRGKQKTHSVYDSIKTQRQVQRNYLRLAKETAGRIEVVDSRRLSVADVANILEKKIRRLMNKARVLR